MNLRPQRREDPEVNITSLVDVVFLLLIFFMVTTTFHREAQLRVELPEASSEPTEVPERSWRSPSTSTATTSSTSSRS